MLKDHYVNASVEIAGCGAQRPPRKLSERVCVVRHNYEHICNIMRIMESIYKLLLKQYTSVVLAGCGAQRSPRKLTEGVFGVRRNYERICNIMRIMESTY